MRLLTHNVLSHNSNEGKGFPLKIKALQVRVVDAAVVDGGSSGSPQSKEQQMAFVKGILPTLNWPALVKVCHHCVCVLNFICCCAGVTCHASANRQPPISVSLLTSLTHYHHLYYSIDNYFHPDDPSTGRQTNGHSHVTRSFDGGFGAGG